jgi:hypothetical protein
LLFRVYELELKNYFRLTALARSKSADKQLAEQATQLLFRTRCRLEETIFQSIENSPVNSQDRLDSLFAGNFFGFSKKQGTSLRLPLTTCLPSKLCGSGCYAHDVLDASPSAIVRGSINGWIANAFEKGNDSDKKEISTRLIPHVKRAINTSLRELNHLPSGFNRRAYIRFSHVGEIVDTPIFANHLAVMVTDLSNKKVDCVVYTRHKKAIELDPNLWVMNFSLDPSSEDRMSWIPKSARIVYSAFGGQTSPIAEVNFLEHHRHGHLKQIGLGRICPATKIESVDRTCDGNKCNRCFVKPSEVKDCSKQ